MSPSDWQAPVAGAVYVTVVAVLRRERSTGGRTAAARTGTEPKLRPGWRIIGPPMAVNCCVAETLSEALVGEIVTDTGRCDRDGRARTFTRIAHRSCRQCHRRIDRHRCGSRIRHRRGVCPESAPHTGGTVAAGLGQTPSYALGSRESFVHRCRELPGGPKRSTRRWWGRL